MPVRQQTLFHSSEEEPAPLVRRDAPYVWEVVGAVTLLFAIFLSLSMILGDEGYSVIGPVGAATAGVLKFLFGSIVAFAVPVFIAWFGVQLFLGRRTSWSPARTLGIVAVVVSVTGIMALPYADDAEMRAETFARAGALGTFMVEWEGLRLVGNFGVVGAAMVLTSCLLAGLVMITGSGLSTLLSRGAASMKAGAGRLPRAPVIFRRAGSKPAFTEEEAAPPPKRRCGARTLFPTADVDYLAGPTGDETDDEPARGSRDSILSGLFRRPVLDAPDPEEAEDPDDGELLDEEALAALRALEEAQIDEEYELAALDEEVEFDEEEEEPEQPASIEEQLKISFHDDDARAGGIVEGNPANDGALTDGLAKMFPNRWEKADDGGLIRMDPKQKKAEEAARRKAEQDEAIRGRSENRVLNKLRRAMGMQDVDSPESLLADDEDDEMELGLEAPAAGAPSEDPLFDERLDARPGGVQAALDQWENARQNQESEEGALARRNRVMAGYMLPDIQLLDDPPRVDNRMSREEILEMSQTLEKTFADFNIAVKVIEVKQGPVVTRFEIKPAAGVKVSRIVGLEHDLAMSMKALSVRIVAPIPGKAAVGIEIPNKNRAGVYLKELVSCADFWDHPSPLAFALGKTIDGQPYYADLKKMPHLLIAGATGAGKSVCLNTIITSFLYRQRPDRLRLIMVDPKRVELSIYSDIPHLISPVVCDAKRAAAALHWAVGQMEERYEKLVQFNVRNIDGYNAIVVDPDKQARHRGKNLEYMPHMVIIVDELADLMVVAKNEVEESIQRLAQMSRAVGIHLILATQRPSVNVITGIIKANFPTRIAFQVSQKVDSRTILDANGAECLLGRGDMLFAPAGAQKPIRIQGAFLSDEEVERVAQCVREQAGGPMYEVEEFEPLLSDKEQKELARMMGDVSSFEDLDAQDRMVRGTNKTMGKVSAGLFTPHEGGSAGAGDEDIDEALVRSAARVVLETRKGSTSMVQRRLKVGFARAGRLMDMLEEMGLVGPYKGSKPRDVMVDCDAALDELDRLEERMQAQGTALAREVAVGIDDPDDEFEEDEDE